MENKGKKLYEKIPDSYKSDISLNILLSERAYGEDGIKKKKNKGLIPEYYYNDAYNTRIILKRTFYKLSCIKEII